jgi:type IV secretion system protein VirD4
MLDEFPALGRLDFFETALAFMAGYGIRAFLIAQSLNQIVKAYGENNAILDNCHVRIAFATNDERTAKRISDALGTATEQRAMRNYAGHRLAPWLAHVMVSRQETARPLLTPGEVMQLAPSEEIVLVSGLPPIRAGKLRYYEDNNFTARLLSPPVPSPDTAADAPRPHDWLGIVCAGAFLGSGGATAAGTGGLQQAQQPVLPSRRRTRNPVHEQPELPGLGEDEAEASGAGFAGALRPLAPVIAAHAVNEGSGRGDDQMPSF